MLAAVDAVYAEFAGYSDEGEDVLLLIGVVVGRDFDEEGGSSTFVDSLQKLLEGLRFVEDAESGGVGGAYV